jgi:hypothetical protein
MLLNTLDETFAKLEMKDVSSNEIIDMQGLKVVTNIGIRAMRSISPRHKPGVET